MSVKITALEAENVKRIKAVALTPSPTGLTLVGGNNNQGKTSVLDALAWALGGERFRPTAAQRDGAIAPAHLKVTLSNGVVVERKGKNASLTVTDPTGRRSGQQLLNAFVEPLALDLPRFMDASDKEKADILLRIIGIGAGAARPGSGDQGPVRQAHLHRSAGRPEKALCRGTDLLPGSPGRAGERLRAHPPAAGNSGPQRREPAQARRSWPSSSMI